MSAALALGLAAVLHTTPRPAAHPAPRPAVTAPAPVRRHGSPAARAAARAAGGAR